MFFLKYSWVKHTTNLNPQTVLRGSARVGHDAESAGGGFGRITGSRRRRRRTTTSSFSSISLRTLSGLRRLDQILRFTATASFPRSFRSFILEFVSSPILGGQSSSRIRGDNNSKNNDNDNNDSSTFISASSLFAP